MTFISYAQNFEDVMLWRALRHVENGFYIDVGAHDPEAGSVTKAFYDRQWSGINIEPIAKPFELLQLARPRDINLQFCIGASDGEIVIYDILPSGLATVLPNIAEMHRAAGHEVRKIKVPVRRLENICIEFVGGEVHFLKIDVEGFERDVLAGMDFSKFRPWIVVVEATIPNSPDPSYQEWEHVLLGANYRFVYFDGLNRFYVSAEHSELVPSFQVPPNFFDGFALASSSFFARIVNSQARQAEADARLVEAKLTALLSSRSWRWTAPLRRIFEILEPVALHLSAAQAKVKAKAILRVRSMLILVASNIVSRSWLKRVALAVLNRAPGLKARLIRVVSGQRPLSQPPALPYIKGSIKLSRPAMRTYRDIVDALHVSKDNN